MWIRLTWCKVFIHEYYDKNKSRWSTTHEDLDNLLATWSFQTYRGMGRKMYGKDARQVWGSWGGDQSSFLGITWKMKWATNNSKGCSMCSSHWAGVTCMMIKHEYQIHNDEHMDVYHFMWIPHIICTLTRHCKYSCCKDTWPRIIQV